jgi:glyoxylase-like metal-dependent hydrolase (beta-lactamase superfamily II)
MLQVQKFTFNAFQENTYIVFDETKLCAIIDPGCSNVDEENELTNFIGQNDLSPVLLLNTHCHIDHILGNAFILKKYGLMPWMHADDMRVLKSAAAYGAIIGMKIQDPPIPEVFIDIATPFRFGNTTFEVLFTPGHSPGHVSFYHSASSALFSGDVLFQGSVGRFDLPGGNYETLMDSILTKLLPLPEDTTVYSGHGFNTTIGQEKINNPFILEAVNSI